MHTIKATFTRMAVITAQLSFAVKVDEPVYMAPRIYNVPMQSLLLCSKDETAKMVADFLTSLTLRDYNAMVESEPIMDMMANPEKYRTAQNIEWTEGVFPPYRKVLTSDGINVNWAGQDLNP